MAPRSDAYSLVEPFVRPRRSRAVAELLETIVPYVVLNVVMMMAVQRGYPMVALVVSVPAAAFLVRLFIIFHDCCHGSFFPSRRANRIVGYITGLLTLTPFDQWQRSHSEHHATAGDLDRRGVGDVWTLTTVEYLAASRPKLVAREWLAHASDQNTMMIVKPSRVPRTSNSRPPAAYMKA